MHPVGFGQAWIGTNPAFLPKPKKANTKATLARVELGDADAALVYATDVRSGDVDGVDLGPQVTAVNQYPIATLTSAPDPALAQAFVDYVVGPVGQSVLSRAGFLAAP